MATNTVGTIIALFETSLAGSVSIGQTTATLSSIKDVENNNIPNGTYVFAIDLGNSARQFFSCTLTGTALTSIVSISAQGIETVGFTKAHAIGAVIKITDFANLQVLSAAQGGGTAIAAILKYASNFVPTLGLFQIPAWDFIKSYVDGVVIAGAPNASTSTNGITRMSVAPAVAITPIAVGDNDPRLPTQAENDAMATGNFAPSSTNKFATQNDIVGIVVPFVGVTAPTGWFVCNGQALSRTTYATLFGYCSTIYGAGDGSTTFNVPDLRGRVVVMQDGGQAEFDALNEAGGSKTHTLTEAEMPSHTHRVPDKGVGAGGVGVYYDPGVNSSPAPFIATSYAGGNSPHNNLQPYRVLNYIIKAI